MIQRDEERSVNVKSLIEEFVESIYRINSWPLYSQGSIPKKILKNVLTYISKGINEEETLFYVDFTVRRSGKMGLVFASDKLFWRALMSEPTEGMIEYAKINSVSVEGNYVVIKSSNDEQWYKINLGSLVKETRNLIHELLMQIIKQEHAEGILVESKEKKDFDTVKFVHKYTKPNIRRSGYNVYEVYKCNDAELAKEFLMTKRVNEQQYYIVVETPMGDWGMDIEGLYKDHLLHWQSDIDSADVEGYALDMLDLFSLEMAGRGINDNFVVHVECGDCGHNWIEGLRYQDWTVVQCPLCQKRNKVNSDKYETYFIKEKK